MPQLKRQPLPTNPMIAATLAPFERKFQNKIVSKRMKYNRFESHFGFFFTGTELQAVAKQRDIADAKRLLDSIITKKEQMMEDMMDDGARSKADIDIAVAGINLFIKASDALCA